MEVVIVLVAILFCGFLSFLGMKYPKFGKFLDVVVSPLNHLINNWARPVAKAIWELLVHVGTPKFNSVKVISGAVAFFTLGFGKSIYKVLRGHGDLVYNEKKDALIAELTEKRNVKSNNETNANDNIVSNISTNQEKNILEESFAAFNVVNRQIDSFGKFKRNEDTPIKLKEKLTVGFLGTVFREKDPAHKDLFTTFHAYTNYVRYNGIITLEQYLAKCDTTNDVHKALNTVVTRPTPKK